MLFDGNTQKKAKNNLLQQVEKGRYSGKHVSKFIIREKTKVIDNDVKLQIMFSFWFVAVPSIGFILIVYYWIFIKGVS